MPFEGEALVVWGHAGAHPVVLGAIHHLRVAGGPVIEVVMAGVTPGGGRASPAGCSPCAGRGSSRPPRWSG